MGAILDKAKLAEGLVNDKFGSIFSIETAHLYSLNETEEGVKFTFAHQHPDVYDLLDSEFSRQVAQVSDFIVVVTCGWASPIDQDNADNDEYEGVAPSQHPLRRRVRLVVTASREGMASVLRFADEPDDIVTDEGEARGTLAEAVQQLFF